MTPLTESTPAERAAYLTYILLRGRPVATQDAAERLEVSQRSVQRTLNAISRAGVPVIYEAGLGIWRIVEGEGDQISPY
jgi:predicted DNA-binding transcriptional regulator YafY